MDAQMNIPKEYTDSSYPHLLSIIDLVISLCIIAKH